MTRPGGRGLRLAVIAAVLALLIVPFAAGLTATVRSGFEPGAWARLAATPGFGRALVLTVWVGVAATALSAMIAAALVVVLHDRLAPVTWAHVLAPVLAAPHAAIAVGLGFLIAPSGWIVRVLSPWATGWTQPPDIATVGDPLGLALILGLVVKEVPFFLLVLLSALSRVPVRAGLVAGRALGHRPVSVWLRVILPQVYPLIRLPVFVVLSYSLSVVDMALVLGPGTPPTLPVLMTRWFLSPDLALGAPASAAALLLGGVVAGAIGLWRLAEIAVARAGRRATRRGPADGPARAAGFLALCGGAVAVLGFGALAVLALWSVTFRWPFSAALPETWSLRGWTDAGWAGPAFATLGIGILATAIALVLAVLWLEGEDRGRMMRARWAATVIYLPLLVPQVAVMPGLYGLLLRADAEAGYAAVIWTHVLYVFPYVMIALSESWRALDVRLVHQAAALGARPWRRLVDVKLPILVQPLFTAAAIGFAVSAAQYLPTLFAGAGRVATLTTEGVTLSSGSDRRVTAVYGLLQAVLPFAFYLLSVAMPPLLVRRRFGAVPA